MKKIQLMLKIKLKFLNIKKCKKLININNKNNKFTKKTNKNFIKNKINVILKCKKKFLNLLITKNIIYLYYILIIKNKKSNLQLKNL